jgi:hypothetical protein
VDGELEIIGCPECDAPAEVLTWVSVSDSGGVVEHVRVRCVQRHWFLLPRDLLPGAAAA